jgi:hypothetical protein
MFPTVLPDKNRAGLKRTILNPRNSQEDLTDQYIEMALVGVQESNEINCSIGDERLP